MTREMGRRVQLLGAGICLVFWSGCIEKDEGGDTDTVCEGDTCDTASSDTASGNDGTESETQSETETETEADCGDCDDDNQCTEDVCEAGKCVHRPQEGACDDGNACTEADRCDGDGVCRGTPMVCDDFNECTFDHCDEGECVFSNFNNRACDDGDSCTENDKCQEGACSGTPMVCDDFNECTEDYCAEGWCVYDNLSGPCDDGDACTVDDVCESGACISGEPLVCEDDGNPCTDEACKDGECVTENNSDFCDDNNPCTTGERCLDGECTGGCPLDCDDNNPCTNDQCGSEGCVHVPNTAPCEDGDACTIGDVCAMGVCTSGVSVNCDDGNVCTDDTCDQGTCIHNANASTCDDGNGCTENDTCNEGVCMGTPLSCDDDNPCTDDLCEAGECVHAANTKSCDDGNACTINDTCSEGTCDGVLVVCDDLNPCTEDSCMGGACVYREIAGPCDDGDACTVNDQCEAGACVAGEPLVCEDDGNVCTDEVCEAGGCKSVNNTASCDDGDACSLNDTCLDGACVGDILDCDDDNPCTDDSCGPDGCVHTPNTDACDDGNSCTQGDVCRAGVCQGTILNCNDGNVCTTDSCDNGVCVHQNNTHSCDDGDACTENDVCTGGVCGGEALDCDDGNPCTDDSCDGNGCVHTPNTASCDDGDACTVGDVCSEGSCMSGETMDCNDFNECTEDFCVEGACDYGYLSGSCDDGDACTVDDVCAEGICGGAVLDCDDGDDCTDDICEAGNCSHTDNGTCVDSESETADCVPTTFTFTQGVNGYDGVLDIWIQQAEPDVATANETVLGVDAQDRRGIESITQVLMAFGGIFGDAPGQIPVGADVSAATLEIHSNSASRSGSPGPVAFYRMLKSFDAESTWNTLVDGVTPDGVEASDVADGEVSDVEADVFVDVDVTATVAAWSQDPATNYGFVVINSNTDGWDFDASESDDESHRPTLVIDACVSEGRDSDTGDTESDTDSETNSDTEDSDSVDSETVGCEPATLTFRMDDTYTGVVDIELQQADSSGVHADGEEISVDLEGTHNAENTETQALLRFRDIFGEGAIPVDASIDSAKLSVYSTNSSSNDISIYRMSVDWGLESWDSLTDGISVESGETVETADVVVSSPGRNTWVEIDVLSSLIAWQQNPTANYGWAMLSDGTDGWDFRSSEYDDEAYRPVLEVSICGTDTETIDTETIDTETIDTGTETIDTGTETVTDTDDSESSDTDSNSCAPAFFAFQMDGIYTGVTDIELQQGDPGEVHADGEEISVDLEGTHNAENTETQALLRFRDIFGEGAIPVDAPIDSAKLSVYSTNSSSNDIWLHRMSIDWGLESWDSLTDGVSVGGEAIEQADAVVSSPDRDVWIEIDVRSSLMAWQQDPTANYGWVMLNDGTDGWDFRTSEYADVVYRPILEVSVCGGGEDTDTETTDTDTVRNISEPLPLYPSDGATGVSAATSLVASVESTEESPLEMTFYGREAGAEPWTLIAIPDTQIYAQNNPAIFKSQTEWIINNREALNIQMVVHEGDLVNRSSSQQQWDAVYDAMRLLIEADMPMTFAPGNHDHAGMTTTGSTELFSAMFPAEDFEAYDWWLEDSDFNDNNNHYVTLNISGEDYLFVGLDFCPDGDEIAWADAVLKAYPDHKAVLTTHALLNDSAEYRAGLCSDTQYIFDDLITVNPNLQIVLCGHMHDGVGGEGEAYRASLNDNGDIVHQMLADYQSRTNGGNGLLRILTFVPYEDRIYVQTYSPWTGEYEVDAESEFVLDYEMEGGDLFSQLGISTVGSDNTASAVFDGAEPGKDYEWYVDVTDGTETVTSSIWRFSTL